MFKLVFLVLLLSGQEAGNAVMNDPYPTVEACQADMDAKRLIVQADLDQDFPNQFFVAVGTCKPNGDPA